MEVLHGELHDIVHYIYCYHFAYCFMMQMTSSRQVPEVSSSFSSLSHAKRLPLQCRKKDGQGSKASALCTYAMGEIKYFTSLDICKLPPKMLFIVVVYLYLQ